jgi:hypothetical protein
MPPFKSLILVGRPASGKSEFIDFMKKCSTAERMEKYHLGSIYELDDFLWLWQKFVEDDCWEAAGYARRFSKKVDHAYVITDSSILDYCLARFNAEYPKQPQDGTIFVEFARGAGDGGYQHALSRLSDEILKDAGILFIYASYEEAYRRNEARYQEKLKHSVLAHKVPEEDMIRFGKEIDWLKITNDQPAGTLQIRGISVPFVTMSNEPELKEAGPLGQRYQQAMDALYKIYNTSGRPA